jgi:hypothetical protein
MNTQSLPRWVAGLLVVPVFFGTLALCVFAAGEDTTPTFKKRGDGEKNFYEEVGLSVIKAVHPSGISATFVSYELRDDKTKADRKDLMIKMEYKGPVTRKIFQADILIKLDTRNNQAWEVLHIDYKDNNNIKSGNLANLERLIKQLNR